jgi:hypothetical protein
LAAVERGGAVVAQSVTCRVPGHIDCNKSVTLGDRFTRGEARRLIMQWCLDGESRSRDGVRLYQTREEHMSIKPPIVYDLNTIPSEEQLLADVNAT